MSATDYQKAIENCDHRSKSLLEEFFWTGKAGRHISGVRSWEFESRQREGSRVWLLEDGHIVDDD